MALRRTEVGRKLCESCALEMCAQDFHENCLECLSASHVSTECVECKKFPFAVVSCRLGLVGDALQLQRWPKDWRLKLRKVEEAVYAPPHNSPSPSDEEEEDDEVGEEDTDPKTLLTQTQKQKPTDPRKPTPNLGATVTDSEWRTGVDNTMTGFGSSLASINESLKTLLEAKSKKRKVSTSKKVPTKKAKKSSTLSVNPEKN